MHESRAPHGVLRVNNKVLWIDCLRPGVEVLVRIRVGRICAEGVVLHDMWVQKVGELGIRLARVREMLKVGFGKDNEGGAVGKEVREMLASLEKEISVWKTGVRNAMEDMPRVQSSG